MAGVLVVGESLIDVVQRPDGTVVEHAGGSAANVAVALARLGRPVQFLTAYGDDPHGAVLARHLNQVAVGVVGDPHSVDPTATAVATSASTMPTSRSVSPAITRPRDIELVSATAPSKHQSW
jgi:fructokinase